MYNNYFKTKVMFKSKIIIILLFLLIGCNDRGTQKSDTFIKNSKGEIYIVILETIQQEGIKPTYLTNDEVETLNKILPKAVKQMNLDLKKMFKDFPSKWPNLVVNLNNYKRQYFPYIINKTGEKEVYINCFCQVNNDYWKTKEVMVLGGGNCFFYGKINLNTGKFHDFMINAPL
ncbi:Probable lipoprotein precursor [Flavobacterium indicum GPTSA100-9 = DSM 17447]|uniref:Probable lipoprotein n=2 Tax=Flavobacterium TaxID=237 RepID=H8XPA3_FLAIG|nr:Probable lipoprotein precursor [Flavobacterium indicum GPTSA100-9 = DSM 17447]